MNLRVGQKIDRPLHFVHSNCYLAQYWSVALPWMSFWKLKLRLNDDNKIWNESVQLMKNYEYEWWMHNTQTNETAKMTRQHVDFKICIFNNVVCIASICVYMLTTFQTKLLDPSNIECIILFLDVLRYCIKTCKTPYLSCFLRIHCIIVFALCDCYHIFQNCM